MVIVTPFNITLEIPALQRMGALYMGNRPLLHTDYRYREEESGVLRWGRRGWDFGSGEVNREL